MKKINLVEVTKEIDTAGRMVIPKEFRERYGLSEYVEVVPTKDGVLIKSLSYKLVEIEKEEKSTNSTAEKK